MTALAAIEGSLLVAWGSRLETHRWTGARLETTAFHDGSIMVTSLSIIKRFVVCGDLHKGITFLHITPDNRAFNNLSKVQPVEGYHYQGITIASFSKPGV